MLEHTNVQAESLASVCSIAAHRYFSIELPVTGTLNFLLMALMSSFKLELVMVPLAYMDISNAGTRNRSD